MTFAASAYVVLLVLGLSCPVAAALLIGRRRFWMGIPLAIAAVAVLPPTINTAPAWFGWFGARSAPQAARTGRCRQAGLVGTRPVDVRTGDELDNGREPCAVELVVNDDSSLSGTPTTAGDCLAREVGSRPVKSCYSFAALEFDRAGHPTSGEQLDALLSHVTRLAKALRDTPLTGDVTGISDREVASNAPQIYVIAYAHGWRHDARPLDTDVRRLRVISANAARNIAERCEIARRDCRTAVLAIYLGWPGAESFVDLAPCEAGGWGSALDGKGGCPRATLAGYLNGLSFPVANAISDRAGSGVLAQLTAARRRLDAIVPNKLLLLGHSLGGNLLLSGLQSLPVRPDGGIGPADLTILLNPAAETSKWIAFANKFRGTRWGVGTPPSVMFVATPCQFEPTRSQDDEQAPALR